MHDRVLRLRYSGTKYRLWSMVLTDCWFLVVCSVIQVAEPDNSKCYKVLLRGSAVEPQLEQDEG